MAVAARKITVPLDEALGCRALLEDASGAGKSDEQVVEDALMVSSDSSHADTSTFDLAEPSLTKVSTEAWSLAR